jgi:hypothetical protein
MSSARFSLLDEMVVLVDTFPGTVSDQVAVSDNDNSKCSNKKMHKLEAFSM